MIEKWSAEASVKSLRTRLAGAGAWFSILANNKHAFLSSESAVAARAGGTSQASLEAEGVGWNVKRQDCSSELRAGEFH